jgi:hypothetical protein
MISDFAAQNPFALLTLIVAPAVLTNAMSVLALSTSNRFPARRGTVARTLRRARRREPPAADRDWRIVHINRVERQAVLLLSALRACYLALGSFVTCQPYLYRRCRASPNGSCIQATK